MGMWIAAALATAILTPSDSATAGASTSTVGQPGSQAVAAPAAEARIDPTICAAPPATPGQVVHGPVLHIPSEGQLCVATGYDPNQWVPIVLAVPAVSRGALMNAVFGQNADCAVQRDGFAQCTVGGSPLGARLRATRQSISDRWR